MITSYVLETIITTLKITFTNDFIYIFNYIAINFDNKKVTKGQLLTFEHFLNNIYTAH